MGTLGENVTAMRERAGLTRVQLASRLDGEISLGTLIRIEQDKQNTTVEKLLRLAEELAATPNQLLGIDALPATSPPTKTRGRFKQGVAKQIRGRRASGNSPFTEPAYDQPVRAAAGF